MPTKESKMPEKIADEIAKKAVRKMEQLLSENYDYRYHELLKRMDDVTSALRDVSNRLWNMLESRKETEKTCDKILQGLSGARDAFRKKIEALSYGTIEELSKLIGCDLRKITLRRLKILEAVLELKSYGKEAHFTNISEQLGARRDANLQKELDEMVREGLLKKRPQLMQDRAHRGRPAATIYEIPEKIRQALRPMPIEGQDRFERGILNWALQKLRRSSYLALALPEKPGKSLPDGIAIPFKEGELNWRKIIAVEAESEHELKYKKEHVAKIIAKRLTQGFSKVILAYDRKYEEEVKEIIDKKLKSLYPAQHEKIVQRIIRYKLQTAN